MERAYNMESQLRALEGLTVTNIVELHGYVQLHFGERVGLSIYNEIEISPESIRVDGLVGKTVTTVTERENAIEIRFLDGTQITIDMHRQAYRGPEALQLNRQGLPPVIWN
jgi:hypothetical protein